MDEEKVTPTPAEEIAEPPATEPAASIAEETAPDDTIAVPAPAPKKQNVFDKFFGITASGSTFKAEIIAGLTTFMAMVYILIVNAGMFSESWVGTSFGAMYIATAIGAIAGTLLMSLLAKMPLAQASGMGVNAFIVYTLLLVNHLTYANAMVFTLLDGVIFVILTVTGLRKKIFEAIPAAVRYAIPVGIGLFIAFIGMQNAKVIVSNSSTLVEFVSFNVLGGHAFMTYTNGTVGGMLPALVAILGVIAIAIMSKKNVKGAILWGILGSAVLYYILAGFTCLAGGSEVISLSYANLPPEVLESISGDANLVIANMTIPDFVSAYGQETYDVIASFATHTFSNGEAARQLFGSIGLSNPFGAFADWGTQSVGQVFANGFNFDYYLAQEGNNVGSLVAILITTALSLCMIDMFDTIGTLYGACAKGNLLDENGVPKNMEKMMLSDAIGTCVGAVAGTSTVTTFVESSAGVSAGGKTGFTSLITAACFFVAMFLSPIAQLIPSAATAAALIWVGVLMMGSVTKIDWNDSAEAIVAFLTFIVMVLGYSISKGIGIGIIAYVVIKVCTGKIKEVKIPTWVIAVLFIATFLVSSM